MRRHFLTEKQMLWNWSAKKRPIRRLRTFYFWVLGQSKATDNVSWTESAQKIQSALSSMPLSTAFILFINSFSFLKNSVFLRYLGWHIFHFFEVQVACLIILSGSFMQNYPYKYVIWKLVISTVKRNMKVLYFWLINKDTNVYFTIKPKTMKTHLEPVRIITSQMKTKPPSRLRRRFFYFDDFWIKILFSQPNL